MTLSLSADAFHTEQGLPHFRPSRPVQPPRARAISIGVTVAAHLLVVAGLVYGIQVTRAPKVEKPIFVDMVKEQTSQVPVLDGLIIMARDLGTEVVAEGVETEAQAFYLRARGVVQAQGFLFAPALKAESFRLLAHALNAPPQSAAEAA